jgi:hypothetical protein
MYPLFKRSLRGCNTKNTGLSGERDKYVSAYILAQKKMTDEQSGDFLSERKTVSLCDETPP